MVPLNPFAEKRRKARLMWQSLIANPGMKIGVIEKLLPSNLAAHVSS